MLYPEESGAHQRWATVGDVGEHDRRDLAVVVDDLGFGVAARRIQDLVEVGEAQRFAVDRNLGCTGHEVQP